MIFQRTQGNQQAPCHKVPPAADREVQVKRTKLIEQEETSCLETTNANSFRYRSHGVFQLRNYVSSIHTSVVKLVGLLAAPYFGVDNDNRFFL